MPTDRDFDMLMHGPGTESEEIPKPYLADKRQVKLHLKHYFPDNVWNSRTVQAAIRHWKSGGVIMRCRNPSVMGGKWQRIDVKRTDGPMIHRDQAN